ncbi:FAD dependent oxidoreductase [Microdochium trichocladiopsis]|uniref:FAD dependent oxidoreductase n=1 Tax=Microdochium trichocladiopsis TaxID=1682393 RepID=A0A9P9BUI5_9PEZI|nr:FAD dependent oxidoreductase [Microdochium trichocladiopsis]KAH7037514.1 FAD dependent oxidoreductase [Microdochium trichocladiopsis]
MNNTVILGAGIVGVSTAYYLSKHQPGSTIHLVEASPELFASASGKAAGFLARDWFPPASTELGALSFEEHRRLAEQDDGARTWGYSKSTSLSLAFGKGRSVAKKGGGDRADAASRTALAGVDDAQKVESSNIPSWLRRTEGDAVEVIGEEGSVAQVDPLALCQHLLRQCLDAGVHLHHPASAISIQTDVRDELSSVCIADTTSSTETDVPCTTIVIAAGAWSPRVFSTLFPKSTASIPVSSLAGYSLVFKSPRWTAENEEHGCHAVFVSGGRATYSPEIFSRVGGQIYIAGLNSPGEPLPELPTDSAAGMSKQAIATLRDTAKEVAGLSGTDNAHHVDDLEVVREGLCFRPVTNRGTPILCRIPDAKLGEGVSTRPGPEGGVYVAAGHGPWGISLSLGTGKVMAEMIRGKELSADISGLDIR